MFYLGLFVVSIYDAFEEVIRKRTVDLVPFETKLVAFSHFHVF